MPTVDVGPDAVTIHLSRLDRLVSFRREVVLPRSVVRAARVVPDARGAIDAQIRLGGTAAPFLVAAGELGSLTGGGTTFAVAYLRRPGVVLDLRHHPWQHVVLSLDDPDRVVRELGF